MAFACLFVPDFPAQAVVRLEPELQGKAVAILAGAPPLTKIFAANGEAKRLGLEVGMTKVQAEAITGAVWRWRSGGQEESAHAALLDCAWTISPRAKDAQQAEGQDFVDAVLLDLSGCEKLFGSAEKIARDLQRTAFGVGLTANVAVAANPLTALSAARGFSGVTVISEGEESAYIGRLSLEALQIPFLLVEALHRWGVRTCAEFVALPEIAIVERLGQEGLRWWRLSRGDDDHPFIAKDFPTSFEEQMELDSPVELLEPLLFVLNRLLEQLCGRLLMHVLAIGEIQVSLRLEGGEFRKTGPLFHTRTIRLPVPGHDSKLLLKLLQLDLEGHAPQLPVTSVRITVVPARTRSRQLGLFLPLSPDPQRLEITLARIQNTVGEGRAGVPVLLDTHGPDSFRQSSFVLSERSALDLSTEKQTTVALRIYRPPLPANFEFHQGKPAALACNGMRREVLAFAGPWKRKGNWWSETEWAREEWDVKLRALHPKFQSERRAMTEEETALYRVYKDLREKRWFVEGIYD